MSGPANPFSTVTGQRPITAPTRRQKQIAPCGRTVAGIQMDAHCLPLLAGPCAVRQLAIRSGSGKPPPGRARAETAVVVRVAYPVDFLWKLPKTRSKKTHKKLKKRLTRPLRCLVALLQPLSTFERDGSLVRIALSCEAASLGHSYFAIRCGSDRRPRFPRASPRTCSELRQARHSAFRNGGPGDLPNRHIDPLLQESA